MKVDYLPRDLKALHTIVDITRHPK